MRLLRPCCLLAFPACLLAACGDDASAPEAARLYWSEITGDCASSAIRWMDPEGGTPQPVISLPGPDVIDQFAVDAAGGKVYFSYGLNSGNDTETVQRANLNGTGLEAIATYDDPSNLSARGVALDPGADHVYWVANAGCSPCPNCGDCSRIMRADLTGGNPDSVLVLAGTRNPRAIAIDTGANRLYWTDIQFKPHLATAALSGAGADTLYDKPLGTTLGVSDVEVDLVHGKVYWLENESIGSPAWIRRSNLDGSGTENVILTGGSAATQPRDLAVDPVAGKVYWSESNSCGNPESGRIRRADLDGTDVETVQDSLGVVPGVELVR